MATSLKIMWNKFKGFGRNVQLKVDLRDGHTVWLDEKLNHKLEEKKDKDIAITDRIQALSLERFSEDDKHIRRVIINDNLTIEEVSPSKYHSFIQLLRLPTKQENGNIDMETAMQIAYNIGQCDGILIMQPHSKELCAIRAFYNKYKLYEYKTYIKE